MRTAAPRRKLFLTTWTGLTAIVCAVTCLAFPRSFAQDLSGPAGESDALDEIIVTARKTAESVQEIPLSMQVLSADLLDQVDLSRMLDLQFLAPGLVVNNLGLNGAGFSLRGIADQGGSTLSVATHLNGVYLGSSHLAGARLFDLERIEVVKGPQGTLYGRNATGGSINIITRAPAESFGADIETAYGSFDTTRLQGHVNAPLGKTSFRLAYVGSAGDGFIRNSVDRRRFSANDFWGLRTSLRIRVSDRLRIDTMVQRVVDDGASGELWLPRPDFLVDPADIRLTTVTLPEPFLRTESDFASLWIEYELGNATLRAITGYASNEVNNVDDCAGMPFLLGCVRRLLPGRHEQWSQEFQVVSGNDTAIGWLVGLYFYDAEGSANFYQLTPVFHPTPTIDRSAWADETAFAVFGQASWYPGERLAITAGLRLTDDRHDLSTVGSGRDDSPTLVSADNELNNQSWRLDLAYALAEDVLVYLGVSTGFKSGGISILEGGVLDLFGPEDLVAYEAGLRSQWLARRLTFNGAAFFYDFRDLQVSTSTVTETGLIFEIDNAARARVYGIDAEGRWRITGPLTLSGGVVWVPKRDFVEYRNDRTGDTLSGNRLVRAPELTAALGVDYVLPLRSAGSLSVRTEYAHRSRFFYTTDNDPGFAQDGFGLLNVYLTYESASAKWYIFAAGRNLGDRDYFTHVFLQASPGYPATYELGFGYRFRSAGKS